MIDRAKVGMRLRRLREDRALGLNQLARLAGVNHGNLSRIERDELPLWGSYAWKLAAVLGPEVLSQRAGRFDAVARCDSHSPSARSR